MKNIPNNHLQPSDHKRWIASGIIVIGLLIALNIMFPQVFDSVMGIIGFILPFVVVGLILLAEFEREAKYIIGYFIITILILIIGSFWNPFSNLHDWQLVSFVLLVIFAAAGLYSILRGN